MNISSYSTFSEDSLNLIPKMLDEAISLLPPMEENPVVGYKINPADLRILEIIADAYGRFRPETQSVIPLYSGLGLWVDNKIPQGKCKPVRQSDLKDL
jgi:hypothetical protein